MTTKSKSATKPAAHAKPEVDPAELAPSLKVENAPEPAAEKALEPDPEPKKAEKESTEFDCLPSQERERMLLAAKEQI